MADARALLRASRDARKITHPHASYSSNGKLLCNLCEVVVKHESAWQSHLHTTQHNLRQSRAQDATATRNKEPVSRKRRTSDPEGPQTQERKKVKPGATTNSELNEADTTASKELINHSLYDGDSRMGQDVSNKNSKPDPAELDAFERELADLEASMPLPPQSQANTVISANPVSAAEIAAQAREEQSAQRVIRDAELEGEKEDAARLLEEELEEMESLESRAKRLRARREALRKVVRSDNQSQDGEESQGFNGDAQQTPSISQISKSNDNEDKPAKDAHDDHDPDDDDDDDDDNEQTYWGFGQS